MRTAVCSGDERQAYLGQSMIDGTLLVKVWHSSQLQVGTKADKALPAAGWLQ